MDSSTIVVRRPSPPVLGTALFPGLGPAATRDRPGPFPRAAPGGCDRAHQRWRLAALGAGDRIEPRGPILVEQLRDRLLHPQREALVGLTLFRMDRVPVPDRDDRTAGAGPPP